VPVDNVWRFPETKANSAECPPRIEKGVVLVAMRKQISPEQWSLGAAHGAGEIPRIAGE